MEDSRKRARIEIRQGDMLSLAVDAIINAANEHLQHGGGIAGQIVKRGGFRIQEESFKLAPVETGEAVITSAGKLPARFVIHAVGPRMGDGQEDEKLYRAIISSLRIANEKGLSSIAIPAISTGIFGFPTDRCARIMKRALRDFLRSPTSLKRIIICLYENEKFKVFLDEFES